MIRQHEIHSQEELQKLLRNRGYRVTQPTLSRDIQELGLAKTPAGYKLPEELLPRPAAGTHASFASRSSREERLDQAVRDHVVSARTSGSLVIVRTPPAAAQPVALAIDGAGLAEVIGTIGGDDTIFVATPNSRAAQSLARRFSTLFEPTRARRARA